LNVNHQLELHKRIKFTKNLLKKSKTLKFVFKVF